MKQACNIGNQSTVPSRSHVTSSMTIGIIRSLLFTDLLISGITTVWPFPLMGIKHIYTWNPNYKDTMNHRKTAKMTWLLLLTLPRNNSILIAYYKIQTIVNSLYSEKFSLNLHNCTQIITCDWFKYLSFIFGFVFAQWLEFWFFHNSQGQPKPQWGPKRNLILGPPYLYIRCKYPFVIQI